MQFMKLKLSAFFIALILFSAHAKAQHEDHEHKHAQNEIGISNNIVYNFHEKESAYSIHLHFIRTLKKNNKFGFGVGYERIFDDHKHNALSIILLYRPIEHFSVNFAPGVSWLATENNSAKPSLHLEGLYEWEFGNFHLGPLVGIAFNTEDLHASLGLHMAIGF